MATMTIDIPDGMTAQVVVGSPDSLVRREPLQITDQRVSPAEPEKHRRRRPFLMVSAGLAFLVVGFTIGTHTRTSHWAAQAETASLATAAPSTAAPALPDPGPVGPPSADAGAGAQPAPSGQMPADLAAALKAPPQVTPAPGQPADQPSGQASGQPASNPFGLGG